MIETGSQKRPSKLNHFSPAERQRVLDKLLAALQKDERVAGVLIVGSGSEGFDDLYSDIDLCVVFARAPDVHPAFQEWGEKLKGLLPVYFYGQSVRGPNIYLWVLLLENFLEIDIAFLCLDDLHARRGRWNTEFDRSGRIEEIMQRSWAGRAGPNIQEVYEERVSWVWHNVMHAAVAAQRGQKWKALYELEQVRNQAIELYGVRKGLETKRFRHVDQMSHQFLSYIQRALVTDFETAEIMRALRAATDCFFAEASHWDEMLGCDLAERFDGKLSQYLELFE